MLLTLGLILIIGGTAVMLIFYPIAGAFGIFLAGAAAYVLGLILTACAETKRTRKMAQDDDIDPLHH